MDSTSELVLSEIEKDAVGEIANMCMGSAATALSTILGRTVAITTPEVTNSDWKTICGEEDAPKYVCVKVAYSEGISGSNVLLLSEKDALSIANIMIGMDSTELTELELSAMGEITNQMIGASTTTLSNILNRMVDISPPEINIIDSNNVDDVFKFDEFLNGGFIQIKFRLVIDGLIDSFMLQVFPSSFVEVFLSTVDLSYGSEELSTEDDINNDSNDATADNAEGAPAASATGDGAQPVAPAQPQAGAPPAQTGQPAPAPTGQAAPVPEGQMPGMPPNMMPMVDPNMMASMMGAGMPYMYMPNMVMPQQMPGFGGVQNNVNVQSAQFNSFANTGSDGNSDIENIDLIMDVPLEVTVELGRTNKSISEILEFKPGTIVELNKVAGDPIDILVNGKLVAIGEVVVIDENFGIRIVDIIK
ncbi:MAG: flagellar motor switch phosphatase FliY [Lachnospiraceae bacterium]|nr:flagellar motor switch phosphatase FliY [Lachnospiraceae bacterium]